MVDPNMAHARSRLPNTTKHSLCARLLYTVNKYASPFLTVLYPKVLEYPSGWLVSLCRYVLMLNLEYPSAVY